ncbi:MAG TPA: efflux RND transporter periplasmic adaptor subunit [Candidatus Acidoferrales bacterium]|jgi:RND family efflux transporter MFP subunit|nr:efflux RND transporter periplasmic adaptor subunit [Candidatus Acidoferrales bacterium]
MATPPKTLKPDLSSLRISDTKRTNPRRSRRWIWIALLVILAGLVGGAAFAYRNRKAEVEVAAATKPATGPAGVLNASGYVTPRRRATIAAKITGRVTGVFFDEGTRVTESQLLATLDDSDARRALDSARADRDSSQAAILDYQVQLKNAEIVLHRTQQLVKEGVSTQEALDSSVMTADSLRAKIALAQQQVVASDARIREQQQAVDNCTIRAPFAGIVVSKDAQVGEMVSPISAGGGFTRTGIATIVDLHSNEFEVDVSEAYIARVHDDQAVNAVLDAYPDWTIPAKVRTVIPTADRQKATVKVRISVTEPDHKKLYDPAKDPRILPDMGVKVTFLENEAKPGAKQDKNPAVALVPQKAIRQDNSSKYVFVLKGDTIERRGVTTGEARGSDVEILAGLLPGATVVVNGPDTLSDGQSVQIQK